MNDVTLVLGANGKTGSRVARRLEKLGHAVRLGSRTATPAFSWDDRSTWSAALHGVSKVYVTYQPDLALPGAKEALGAFAIAAKEAGATRIVLLSGRGEPQAVESEDAMRAVPGIQLTVIRASWFAQNFDEGHLAHSVAEGVLAMPGGDVREPFIDASDIADVAVVCLLDDAHVGKTYELTGPRLLGFADVAAELTEAAGRPVQYVPISVAEFKTGLAHVMPPAEAAFFGELFPFLLDGHNAFTTDTVERLLGRKATDFKTYAERAFSRSR